MLIEQVSNLKKMRTENLKFRINLQDLLVSGQFLIILRGRMLTKIFEFKIEACTVNAVLNMTFKHFFSFTTDLAANFGSNQNHGRNHFPAFALCHLKWLCCSIGI